MLKSVDILIGFTVIMLVVSIAVTLVTQMITSIFSTFSPTSCSGTPSFRGRG